MDSSDSQDTVIIEETSSSKRMRLDEEAKKVGINFFSLLYFWGIKTGKTYKCIFKNEHEFDIYYWFKLINENQFWKLIYMYVFIIIFKLVETILVQKPVEECIITEYNRTKSLGDETRRKMVNILAAHMTEKNGTSPTRQVKEKYARGIVALFPYLSDPFSKNGYISVCFEF